jgi:aspartate ammonia-lyase
MHVNEILANRASELMGGRKGQYEVNPNDDVNYGQSTNDVIPMSARLTILLMQKQLLESASTLEAALRKKGQENKDVIIGGRTHLQDAVPITLGQVFGAWADAVKFAKRNVVQAGQGLEEVSLGATAVGTGLNTHPDYRQKVIQNLSKLTGIPFKPESNYFLATNSMAGVVRYSSALKDLAVELDKICNDLRLYGSSPYTAIGELKLPELQPGSSIMPGKVNPVIPELVNLVMFRVMGNDYTVTLAAHSGQLQLNAYEPIEGLAMMESQHLLYTTSQAFRQKCIDGITVNEKVLEHYMETTVGIVTALNPVVGYEKATELAQEAYKSGKGILQVIREKKVLTEEQIKDVLDPVKLTNLDKSLYKKKK